MVMRLRYVILALCAAFILDACNQDETSKTENVLTDIKQEIQKDRAELQHECGNRNMDSCVDLGVLFYNEKRYAESLRLEKKACEAKNAMGCYNLGVIHQDINSTFYNPQQSKAFYEKACDSNEPLGCSNLGKMYFDGNEIQQDLQKAERLLRKSCDLGLIVGCTNLGYLHYTKGSYDLAIDLYQKGCNADDLGACNDLGWVYYDKLREYARAKPLFEKACNRESAIAYVNLGHMYVNGRGVLQDIQEAKRLNKKACDLGSQQGCDNYSLLNK